ncbi:MAG: threonine synthase [Epulopiscium sp. Nuni2H_MBin001]|nr:MAG: threonine synthase [Epulopiscium sp. Nuni2H_MBin001]
MLYESTRGDKTRIPAAQAIVKGLATDRGLYTPSFIPTLSDEEIVTIATSDYKDVAKLVFSKFLTDFSADEIDACIKGAYENTFDTPEIAPLQQLDDNTSILELWHGPTCAFKDVALQALPYLLTTSMKITGESNKIAIIVATSGDTGKAALEGFKDVEGTSIVVMYPSEGVSLVQKQQMITQQGENVNVIAIKGNFDDAQTAAKNIFTNPDLEQQLLDKEIKLSSANSINWGRLLPQIVYYIKSSLDIETDKLIDYVVPTGNFGNILAGYYAKKMGAPIGKLICASNSNNVLTDFIKTGVYDRRREFVKTLSPSMDILISSNLERFLFELSDHDSDLIDSLMNKLDLQGYYEIPQQLKLKMQGLLEAEYCTDQQTQEAIKQCWDKYNYLLDTHTAVAYNVHQMNKSDNPTIIVSTASPFKFPQGVYTALNGEVDLTEYQILKELSNFTKWDIPAPIKDLENIPVLHNTVCDKKEIVDTIIGVIN